MLPLSSTVRSTQGQQLLAREATHGSLELEARERYGGARVKDRCCQLCAGGGPEEHEQQWRFLRLAAGATLDFGGGTEEREKREGERGKSWQSWGESRDNDGMEYVLTSPRRPRLPHLHAGLRASCRLQLLCCCALHACPEPEPEEEIRRWQTCCALFLLRPSAAAQWLLLLK